MARLAALLAVARLRGVAEGDIGARPLWSHWARAACGHALAAERARLDVGCLDAVRRPWRTNRACLAARLAAARGVRHRTGLTPVGLARRQQNDGKYRPHLGSPPFYGEYLLVVRRVKGPTGCEPGAVRRQHSRPRRTLDASANAGAFGGSRRCLRAALDRACAPDSRNPLVSQGSEFSGQIRSPARLPRADPAHRGSARHRGDPLAETSSGYTIGQLVGRE